jgi:hypothetical protein
MVENLAESPGMCSDGPGSAPIKIPKRELFSLREGKKNGRAGDRVGWGKKTASLLQPARPGSHPRAAQADGPRHPRGQSARRADGPDPRRGLSVNASRTSSAAPSPHKPRGRSALPWRTVRQEQPDGPSCCCGRSDLLFNFSVKSLAIKSFKDIFWDHCSKLMKEKY